MFLILIVLFGVIFFSQCNDNDNGYIGHIQFYEYNVSENQLNQRIVDYLDSVKTFEPDSLAEIESNDTKNAYYFLDFHSLYFSTSPKEIIYLGFSKIDGHENFPKCTLSIDAVSKYIQTKQNYMFYKGKFLSDEEKEQIKRRIENQVLNNLNLKYRRVD